MKNDFWWETGKENDCLNEILKFSVEARIWYLKTDVKVRLKRFILFNEDFQDVINLWKRLNIIKKDLGEETGREVIKKAMEELKFEFKNAEIEQDINGKITDLRGTLTDDFIKLI
jgi:hypothetical protein